MSKMSKIKLEFRVPKHGWLPTTFECEDFELDIVVSDVPVNPISQLCDSLIQLAKGIKSPDKVLLHLEPYCYYLQLKRLKDRYVVIILEAEGIGIAREETFQIEGDFDTIVLPVYRGIKKFASQAYKPPHWEAIPQERIIELKRVIKQM